MTLEWRGWVRGPVADVPLPALQSIGSLIDREYMRRAEDKPNVFHYVA